MKKFLGYGETLPFVFYFLLSNPKKRYQDRSGLLGYRKPGGPCHSLSIGIGISGSIRARSCTGRNVKSENYLRWRDDVHG